MEEKDLILDRTGFFYYLEVTYTLTTLPIDFIQFWRKSLYRGFVEMIVRNGLAALCLQHTDISLLHTFSM